MKERCVSIIIPVYNGADFLREAIDSALSQTYPNIEVIVVNDGSNDEGKTREIALSYGEKIRYFEKENGGVSSALNLGIREMTGDYFSWLSHDDVYTKDKVENQINAIKQLSDSSVVTYCRVSAIDSRSRSINRKSKSDALKTGEILSSSTVLRHLLDVGSLNGCCFLLERSVFEECGLFDESLRYSQDILMWYRIFLTGKKLFVLEDVGVLSRIHENQQTQTGRARYQSDSLKVAEMILPAFGEISSKEDNFVFLYARHHAVRGNKAVVEKSLLQLKDSGISSPALTLKLKAALLYGKCRPAIRRAYYRLFQKIKTE